MSLLLLSKSYSQESPKNIISEENDGILYQEDYVDEKNPPVILQEDESKKNTEPFTGNEQKKRK